MPCMAKNTVPTKTVCGGWMSGKESEGGDECVGGGYLLLCAISQVLCIKQLKTSTKINWLQRQEQDTSNNNK